MTMEINDDFERFCQIAQRSPRNSLAPDYHSPQPYMGRRSTQCGYLTSDNQNQVKRSSSFREPRRASYVAIDRGSGNISSTRSPVRSDRHLSPNLRADLSPADVVKRASFSAYHRSTNYENSSQRDTENPHVYFAEDDNVVDESWTGTGQRMNAASRHRAGSMKETGRKRMKTSYRPSAPAVFSDTLSPHYGLESHSPGRYVNQNNVIQSVTNEEQLIPVRRFQRKKDGQVISKGDGKVPQIELYRSGSHSESYGGITTTYPHSPTGQTRPTIYTHDASDHSDESSTSDNEVIEIPAITTTHVSSISQHGSTRPIQRSAHHSPHTLCPESRNRSRSWAYVYEPELTNSMQQTVVSSRGEKISVTEQPLTVQVLGSSRVGKTSLCMQFQTSESLDVTLERGHEDELTRSITVEVNNEKFHLILVDTNFSNEEFPECSESDIIESADAYVVVYAIDDKSTFLTARSIINYLLAKCKRSSAILLAANKSDLVRTRAVSPEDGKNLATVYSCPFFEISTSLNHRVDELLVGIVTEIQERRLEVDKERNRLDRMASTRKRSSITSPGHRRSFGGTKSTTNSLMKFFRKHFSRKEDKSASTNR